MRNMRHLKIGDINKNRNAFSRWFEKASNKITKASGSPVAFLGAFVVILLWAVTGPIFHFSDTWQLVINNAPTIITFLMVFIIQQSQNNETIAIPIKLNGLIACREKASNRLIDVEDLTDDELQVINKFIPNWPTWLKQKRT